MFKYISKTQFSIPQALIDRAQAEISAGTLVDAPPYWTKIRPFVGNFEVEDKNNLQLIKTAEGIRHRFDQAKQHWNKPLAVLRQNTMSDELTQDIADSLPAPIKELNPRICIQTINGGCTTPPHKDNSRACSLFYLFDSNQAETIFYQYLPGEEDKQELPMYPDINSIEPKFQITIEEHCWHIFDTKEIHSVHADNINGTRTTLCLEFAKVPATELYNIVNTCYSG
jgi:hypothetical protein